MSRPLVYSLLATEPKTMTDTLVLEKWVWTENDFEQMGWHDTRIYSLAFFPDTSEFAMDLDYILRWVYPQAGETHFWFWVAPVTMVFENVHDIQCDIQTNTGLEIADITRENPQTPKNMEFITKSTEWTWNIECQEGLISLKAAGYNMFIRATPSLLQRQAIGVEGRGGISFLRGQSG
jgi:hypothetical protein